MTIFGGLDIHRGQVTFGYVITETGEVATGKIRDPHRERFKAWLAELATSDAEFAMEGCIGWLYLEQEFGPRRRWRRSRGVPAGRTR